MIDIVRLALEEDIGPGDITTDSCVPAGRRARGRFLAREPLIVAGLEVLHEVYEPLLGTGRMYPAPTGEAAPAGTSTPDVGAGHARPVLTHAAILQVHRHNGDACRENDILAEVSGPARLLLTRERVALNFLQRLSGVATLARKFADAVAGTGCRVLDTRKTTPGMRALEKAAAAAGGITNHRRGLFDAILIKNNHIAAAGGVRAALEAARQAAPADTVEIEIEVRTRAELHEALACGATHLLLDNLSPAEAAVWIREIAGRATVELSGGITLDTVRTYAETGADFVSAGAITHSAPAADIAFRLELL
jgi:nicotinate-nucleotide pyrophosphorylase (carboxylating)